MPYRSDIIRRLVFEAIFIGMVMMSCKKSEVKADSTVTNFDQVFEIFWEKVQINYAFWDVDKTDWDQIHLKYKPLFDRLDLNNAADIKKSVSYFNDMTKSLIDSHFSISFEKNLIRDSVVYPAFFRKQTNHQLGQQLDYGALDTTYLDAPFTRGSYVFNASGKPSLLFTQVGTINRKIICFKLNQFALVHALNAGDSETRRVINQLDSYLKNSSGNIKAIIFDLRGNNGGDAADLTFLLSKILNAPLSYGYLRYKNGNNKLDFTPWVPTSINSISPSKKNLKFFALVDNYSASLSEVFTIAIRQLPSSLIVGEQTWGATSPLSSGAVYNYGSFEIPGFLKVTMAVGEFRDKSMNNFEGIGISPDFLVPTDISSFQNRRDTQLEKCISLIP